MKTVVQIAKYPLAGMPWRIHHAIQRIGRGWSSRLFVMRDVGLGFPLGERWGDRVEAARAADVVHVHHVRTYQEERWLHDTPEKVLVTIHGMPDTDYRRPLVRVPEQLHLTTVNPMLRGFWPRAEYIPNFFLWEQHTRAGISTRSGPREWESKIDKLLVPPLNAGKSADRIPSILERAGLHGAKMERVDLGPDRIPNSELLREISRYRWVWDNLNDNPGVLAFEAASLGTIPIVAPSAHCRREFSRFFRSELRESTSECPWTFHKEDMDDVPEQIRLMRLYPQAGRLEADRWFEWAEETDWFLPVERYIDLYEDVRDGI